MGSQFPGIVVFCPAPFRTHGARGGPIPRFVIRKFVRRGFFKETAESDQSDLWQKIG